MKIQLKIMLAILSAVLITVAIIAGVNYYETKAMLTSSFKTVSANELNRMKPFVDFYLQAAVANVNLISQEKHVANKISALSNYTQQKNVVTDNTKFSQDEAAIFNSLDNMMKTHPEYVTLFIANSKGGLTIAPNLAIGDNFDPTKRGWYSDLLQNRKTYITGAYLSQTGDMVTSIIAPVKNGTEIVGAAGIDIALNTLNREINKVTIGKTGYMILIDETNAIISEPHNKDWLGKKISELPREAYNSLAGLIKDTNINEITHISLNDKDWLANSIKTDNGWTLIVLQEDAEVFYAAIDITLTLLKFAILPFLLVTILSWFTSNGISRPILILSSASKKVADGDLHAIPEKGKFTGEIEVLHQSLLGMVSNLSELIETANIKIKEAEEALELSRQSVEEAEEAKRNAEKAKAEGIQVATAQISTVVDNLAISSNSLVAEVESTKSSTDIQQNLIENIVIAMDQMNSVSNEVAQSSTKTAELAHNTFDRATIGREFMQSVTEQMTEIENKAATMQENIDILGNQVHSIDSIMNVISDIADQTNLLALNAAIEAARAGDAGRGFAVVADEVRKLAEKTMEATKQVNQTITNIQDSAKVNMLAVNEAVVAVSKSSEVVQNASNALTEIETLANETASEVRLIATATEEQVSTVNNINSNTSEIREKMNEVSAGQERASCAVQDLADISNKLNSIIENLQKNS